MEKSKIIKKLTSELESILKTLVDSAKDAHAAATDEESKAENKYDTRGLEASYLAGAQAKRADELKQNLDKLKTLEPQNFGPEDGIGISALIQVEINGEDRKWFFILPFAGGTKLQAEDTEVLIITPNSPIGQRLSGRNLGEIFEVDLKGNTTEYEIISVR